MAHLRLVCLDIEDAASYLSYREGMEPLLAQHGGRFVLDVEGAASIHPADFAPNRVLLIAFPDDATAAGFFADPAYVAVRTRWFRPAVRRTHAEVVG